MPRTHAKPKITVLATIAAMLVSLAAFSGIAKASETARVGGYRPVNKDVYVVPVTDNELVRLGEPAVALPTSYRSDEQLWAANVQIKDQDTTGLCWALSTATAAEYSHAKELYEATGTVAPAEETSGAHLAQFLYNHVDDPLGNTTNDKGPLSSSEHWATAGGNQIFAMQHLATYSGLCSEEKAPLEDTTKYVNSSGRWTNRTTQLAYDTSLAYDDCLTLQECVYVSEADMATVKNLVLAYGAVSTSIAWEDKYLNLNEIDPTTGQPYEEGRSYYCYDSDPEFNHAVTIVGWDDNYPKENFTHTIRGKSNAAAFELTTPSRDGAWILQNSWGDYTNDGGFFYVSYDSVDYREENLEVFAFDMQPANTYAYNFQYDGTYFCLDSTDTDSRGRAYEFKTDGGTRAANVYTNTTGSALLIEAVGFTTYNDGTTHYDVSVYTGLKNANNPTSGTLADTTRVTTTTAGCKTAKLNNAVYVAPGETFAVVFSFPENNAFGVEMDYDEYDWHIDAQTKAGQSFFSASNTGSWKDMNDYGACFRIKAFANETELSGHLPGWAFEDGSWYYYEDDGSLRKSAWLQSDGAWYYLDADGRMLANSWIKSGSSWYYFGSDGRMLANSWVKSGGAWYYLNSNGSMAANSWVKSGGSWYYLSGNGSMAANSWVKSGGSWYYLSGNGSMAANSWVKSGGSWYYLSGNGSMAANSWVKSGGTWYYLGSDGKMVTNGWIKYNGAWYYFNGSGACTRKVAA